MKGRTRNVVFRTYSSNNGIYLIPRLLNIGRQDSEDGYYYKPHIQEEFEFIYVIKGKLNCKIDGYSFNVAARDMYFVQPGQQHEEFSAEGFVSFYYIKCNLFNIDGSQAVVTDDISKQCFRKVGSETCDLFQLVFQELRNKKLGYWQIAESALMQLLCRIIRINNSKEAKVEESVVVPNSEKVALNRIIQDAVDFVKSHESQIFSVSEIASAVNVSPSYLHALFKKYLNMSPIKYMMLVKMDQAKRMLLQTQMSITCISNCLGFENVSIFTKAFKRICKVSPTVYRTTNSIS